MNYFHKCSSKLALATLCNLEARPRKMAATLTDAAEDLSTPALEKLTGQLEETSAGQAVVAEVDMHCCSCHRPTHEAVSIIVVRAKTKTSKDIRRCRPCHALRARCDRIVTSRGASVEDWTTLSDEDKRAFYIDAQDAQGGELVAKMQETIMQSASKRSSVKFVGTGDWIDEQDLNTKYRDQPGQLENIKKIPER